MTQAASTPSSSRLLDQIRDGKITPIGWGCGQLFQLRRFIHDFEVQFTLHTRPPAPEVDSVKVYEPSVLASIDPARHVLVVYTIDFMDEVLRHCKPYPALRWLPFNAAELGVVPRLRQLRAAADTFCSQGVSYGSVSQLLDEFGY